MVLTYADLLDHALAFGGTDATQAGTTLCRRAVQNAYREVPTAHDWTYYWAVGRVTTNGVYSTGTVAYDAGANELTLTGGTWPAWAAYGYVVVGTTPYTVATRASDTVLTLSTATPPGDDIDAGTSYQLVRDQYPLPSDFVCGDEVVVNDIGMVLNYTHPRAWVSQRRTNTGPGQPRLYSYVGDAQSSGSLRLVLWPAPDAQYNLDFLYRRRPRALRYESVTDGTVTLTASSATATGSGTAFKSGMVGSLLRVAADSGDPPTGPAGGNPAAWEAKITAVASGTSLTLDSTAPDDYAGVSYVISDPADIEELSMSDYLHREIEKQMRIVARMKPLVNEAADYQLALVKAMEADTRTYARQAAGRAQRRRTGFAHYPRVFSG